MSNILTRTALGVTAAVCLLAAPGAYAQFKSLDITVPGGPGSGLDQTGRAIEDALRKDGLVPNVKVVNVPGGGGMIAVSQFLTTKKRDPQAVITTGAGAVFFPITNKTPVSVADITPVARLAGEYEVMVVRADSDIKTLEDLIAKFKANPGSVAWGGGSPGSTENIFFARIAKAAGVDLKRLNFISHPNTGEVVVSALSGQVAVAGGGWQDFETQVQAGKLRAIAVASPERLEGDRRADAEGEGDRHRLLELARRVRPPDPHEGGGRRRRGVSSRSWSRARAGSRSSRTAGGEIFISRRTSMRPSSRRRPRAQLRSSRSLASRSKSLRDPAPSPDRRWSNQRHRSLTNARWLGPALTNVFTSKMPEGARHESLCPEIGP